MLQAFNQETVNVGVEPTTSRLTATRSKPTELIDQKRLGGVDMPRVFIHIPFRSISYEIPFNSLQERVSSRDEFTCEREPLQIRVSLFSFFLNVNLGKETIHTTLET